jgi:ketosteroid isomerase-like protein
MALGCARKERGESEILSGGMPSVVATPIQYSGPPRRSRNFEERLIVRFPSLYRRLTALVLRLLNPRSRLRRALVRRQVVSVYGAVNRRDFELLLVRYAHDVQVRFDPDLEALGLGGTFRGHDGLLKLIETFGEAWERWELLPAVVLDMGNRFVGLGRFRLPGTASGLELEREFAQVWTFRDGLVANEQEFLAWDKGLRAVGLDSNALALPSRGEAGQAASSAG